MDCGAKYGASRSGFFKQAKAIFPHDQTAEGGKGGIFGESSVFGQAGAVRSREVVAAVSKKGHRLRHVDLAAAVWTNPAENAGSGVGDDANRFTDAVHGFGLHNNRGNGFLAPVSENGEGRGRVTRLRRWSGDIGIRTESMRRRRLSADRIWHRAGEEINRFVEIATVDESFPV